MSSLLLISVVFVAWASGLCESWLSLSKIAAIGPACHQSQISSYLRGFAVWQGHFPEAEKDPVIQIASMVTVQGESTPIVKNVMTLNSCAAIVGAEVMSFNSEADMLKVPLLTSLTAKDLSLHDAPAHFNELEGMTHMMRVSSP